MNRTETATMCVKDKFHSEKYHTDIECRIVRLSKDGHSGLLKLYRNGVELPTRRNVWIDFAIINNKDTHYNCAGMLEIDGKAYDVIITDDNGICHYNGELKRERQTFCAQKYGEPIPEDTLEIREYWAKRREQEAKEAASLPAVEITRMLSPNARRVARNFILRHSHWNEYQGRDIDSFTDDELRQALVEMKDFCN